MTISIRNVELADRDAIISVESKSTPNLRYLGAVFEQFRADSTGDFLVAELDGYPVACAKFTVLPDNTAWLESLRVDPAYQRRGVGKAFYRRFFELAEQKNIHVMRMYTNIGNAVSKGLAEQFGFTLAGTYRGTLLSSKAHASSQRMFQLIEDPKQAAELLMPIAARWQGFLILNRTFYAFTPSLCHYLSKQRMVYHEPDTNSVIVLGARFLMEQALHIGCIAGNGDLCLDFAIQKAHELGIPKVQCMFPPDNAASAELFDQRGFQAEAYDCIVMEVKC